MYDGALGPSRLMAVDKASPLAMCSRISGQIALAS
jgi:hypothetical protein